LQEHILFQHKLPAQVAPEDVETATLSSKLTEAATMGSVLGTIIVSILLFQSLNLLFSMVGSLQYILYLSILNTNFPGNANMVFEILMTIMTFDIVPE
jgi:hypothetical protein